MFWKQKQKTDTHTVQEITSLWCHWRPLLPLWCPPLALLGFALLSSPYIISLHTCAWSKKVCLQDLEKTITCAERDQLHKLPLCSTHIAWNWWVFHEEGDKGIETEGRSEWWAGRQTRTQVSGWEDAACSSCVKVNHPPKLSSQLQLLLNLVHNTKPVKRLPP